MPCKDATIAGVPARATRRAHKDYCLHSGRPFPSGGGWFFVSSDSKSGARDRNDGFTTTEHVDHSCTHGGRGLRDVLLVHGLPNRAATLGGSGGENASGPSGARAPSRRSPGRQGQTTDHLQRTPRRPGDGGHVLRRRLVGSRKTRRGEKGRTRHLALEGVVFGAGFLRCCSGQHEAFNSVMIRVVSRSCRGLSPGSCRLPSGRCLPALPRPDRVSLSRGYSGSRAPYPSSTAVGHK